MSCLIEQRETFNVIILPEALLDEAVKEELIQHAKASMNQKLSVIMNFSNVPNHVLNSFDFLEKLHTDLYSNDLSFVLTQASDAIKQDINNIAEQTGLNYAPTLAEAIDIVSMEHIERELLGEE